MFYRCRRNIPAQKSSYFNNLLVSGQNSIKYAANLNQKVTQLCAWRPVFAAGAVRSGSGKDGMKSASIPREWEKFGILIFFVFSK